MARLAAKVTGDAVVTLRRDGCRHDVLADRRESLGTQDRRSLMTRLNSTAPIRCLHRRFRCSERFCSRIVAIDLMTVAQGSGTVTTGGLKCRDRHKPAMNNEPDFSPA